MILQALTAYYEQLLKQGKVEAPGWDSKFKVSYELRLGPDGQLLALNDLRQEVPKGKKTVIAPRELPVPHRVKRASGVAANFLCDNTSYLLGADEKGKPERSRQCFEACAALHHKVLDGVDSPAAKAILAFFDSWKPDTAPTHPLLAGQWAALNNNANLVFGYESPDGAHWLATTDDAIRDAWQSAFDTSDADAETVAYVRRVMDEAGVVWQIGEMGKIDAGGGGTVAQYMANRNITTIDAGVPVLSMHAPFETVGKLDCYMNYLGCKAVYLA